MIAIDPKGFVKRFLQSVGSLPVQRNKKFLLSLKEKISLKGRSIDDSNEYKFIYVPSSSSSEKKKTFSTIAGFFIIFFPSSKV